MICCSKCDARTRRTYESASKVGWTISKDSGYVCPGWHEMSMSDKVESARKDCGCTQCTGGYVIGGNTIALSAGAARPTSCVAGLILKSLLRED